MRRRVYAQPEKDGAGTQVRELTRECVSAEGKTEAPSLEHVQSVTGIVPENSMVREDGMVVVVDVGGAVPTVCPMRALRTTGAVL